MTKSLELRVEALERIESSGVGDFVRELTDARLRAAAAGGSLPENPITAEMMADPLYGRFYRQISDARERVRVLRRPDIGCRKSEEQR